MQAGHSEIAFKTPDIHRCDENDRKTARWPFPALALFWRLSKRRGHSPTAGSRSHDGTGAGHLGEVSDLEPSKSGALTIDLAAGDCIVQCNNPGHFISRMWSLLTVTL